MTFGDMISRVGELINQDLSGDTKTVTRTEVKANLNRAYHKVANAVSSLGQDYYYREATADFVADQRLYGLPSDIRKLERLEVSYDGSTYRKAIRIDRNAINDPTMVFSQDKPHYAVVGNMFEIFPTPTTNVTNGIKLWYLETLTDLSDNADEPKLPNIYQDLPIEYAAGKAKMRQGLIDEGKELLNEFYTEVARMESEFIERNEDDSDFVIIRNEY